MKRLMILVLIIAMAGCDDGENERWSKNKSDTGSRFINLRCINGVGYYSGLRSLAVAYNVDGSIKLCDKQ